MTRRRRQETALVRVVAEAKAIDALAAEQYIAAAARYDVAHVLLDHARVSFEAAKSKYALQHHALTGQLAHAEAELKKRRAYIEQNYNVSLDDFTISDGKLTTKTHSKQQ